MGKGYDTWADATWADVGEMKSDTGRLPSRVDTSTRTEYPPVYEQIWGACGQFASVASIFTYEMNVLRYGSEGCGGPLVLARRKFRRLGGRGGVG